MIRTVLVSLLSLASAPIAESVMVIKSTAVMDLAFNHEKVGASSLSEIFLLEEDLASFFMNSMEGIKLDSNEPIDVSVAIREETIKDRRRSYDGIVSCTSISDGSPIDLDTILMRVVDPRELPFDQAKISFRPYKDNEFLGSGSGSDNTAASKALTAFTVFLSITLLVVASVLLYITGGWNVCRQKCSNCLFEEVDDDDDDFYEDKGTFQVDSMRDDGIIDEDRATVDDESVETGLQTNPTGILGAEADENDNPAAGLGIQTPGTREYDIESETPLSESNRPLGITSMREMPDPNTPSQPKGGLAHMIMERLNHYNNNGQSEKV